jgi:Tol biopolymer transport system component
VRRRLGGDLLTHRPATTAARSSPDGSKIAIAPAGRRTKRSRGSRGLLAQNLAPTHVRDLLDERGRLEQDAVDLNGAANFAPYFTPDGKRLIFASNMASPRGRDFDLYLVGLEGGAVDRVTFCPSFDSFPMFSPDGTKLVFASNRNGAVPGETNIFVANWVE